MATLPEVNEFVEGIYQLEITDPVEAGVDGMANLQAKQLASRTLYLKMILDNIWPQFSVREVDVPAASIAAYKSAHFEASGLGKSNSIWAGWAICNGANGTRDRGGRVSIGDGNGYTVGQTGGNKDAAVISHSHDMTHIHGVRDAYYIESDAGVDENPISGLINLTQNYTGSGSTDQNNNRLHYRDVSTISQSTTNTQTAGVSGVDRNMQPYIVTLYLMKL